MQKEINKLLETTAKLIESEKYEEALDMLKEESKNPLYSLSEQEVIKNRIVALNKFLKQLSIDIRWAKANKNDLIKMFNSEGYELPLLDLLFEKHAKEITNTDLIKLNQILLDDSVSNEMKVTVLNIFKDYDIEHTFDFVNTLIGKTFKVDTRKDFSPASNDLIFMVGDKLATLYFKETSKETMAKQIVNAIYYYYFGGFDQIEYSYDELFNNIVDYIEHAFLQDYKVDSKFNEWINKILNQ